MILVTGGSSGIGKAVVALLCLRGYNVLYPTSDELDVSDYLSWCAYINSFEGGLELEGLVNCAGVSSIDNVDEVTPIEFARVMEVNAQSVLFGMKMAEGNMHTGGSIVNVASIFAQHGGTGKATAYQASKAAVLALSRNAAITYAPRGIRVNTVIPGFVSDTRMTNGKGYEDYAAQAPMKRMVTPREVAEVITFLLSSRSSGMTGAEVHVDAGWNAR